MAKQLSHIQSHLAGKKRMAFKISASTSPAVPTIPSASAEYASRPVTLASSSQGMILLDFVGINNSAQSACLDNIAIESTQPHVSMCTLCSTAEDPHQKVIVTCSKLYSRLTESYTFSLSGQQISADMPFDLVQYWFA